MASDQSTSQNLALDPTEVELIKRVHARFPNNEPENFHFFYDKTPLDNYYPCSIEENDLTFRSSEQYLTYYKAKVFNDDDIAEKVLQAQTPDECKQLGRLVKNFDKDIWHKNRTRIVSNALYLKFTQNENLKQALLNYSDCLIVEAADDDSIWGIGLNENDPLIKKRANWKGLNLLGYILTDTLHRILDENKTD